MLSLASAPLGAPLRVTAVNTLDESTRRQLLGLGLLAGAEIVLVQKFPVYQVKVGMTQVQLSPDRVSTILVQPIAAL
ncbi:MAG TPA: FeoA domain-containing protein [Trichocoleus sp.]